MKKEYVDNTVLLPILQYILHLFRTFPRNEAFQQLESYKELIRSNRIFEDWYKDGADKGSVALDELFECIEAYEKDPDDGSNRFLNLSSATLRCGLCKDCNDCVRAFAFKIYEALEEKTFPASSLDKDYEYEKLPNNIEKHLRANATKIGKYYDERHLQNTRTSGFKNNLVILKGTSSSTPSVLNAAFDTQQYHGGGFFISWDGFGIAVDPGYHFLANLHEAGLDVNDIDAVVITHEHIDHNIDMRVLDDLIYNQRRFGDGFRKISWYVDSVTYNVIDSLRAVDSGFKKECCEVYKMTPASGNEEYDAGIYLNEEATVRMKVFRTVHCYTESSDKTKVFFNHSFGMELFLSQKDTADKGKERKIFYSSDTKYLPDMVNCVKDSDIVIANISSIYKTDLLRRKEKDSHLGYMGCYELLKNVRHHPPKFFLISEFWNGITDIRFDVCGFLKKQIERNEGIKGCNILPAEIGMVIDIKNLRIKCDSCGRFVDDFITVRQNVDDGKITIYCSDCYY